MLKFSLLYVCRVICVEELMAVLVSLGNPRSEEEVAEMIQEEDADQDGVISREEFFSMFNRRT